MNKLKDSSIESLLSDYAQAAALHGETTWNGDYDTANFNYEVLAAIYRELRARGRGAQLCLLPLLKNSNPDVRGWAASHALEFAPEHGVPVLEDLSHSGGLPGFSAEMTLKEWRKGTLKFP
ncbi:MAG TPA: hypothetical protein VF074_01905 [Pyrinomonadaceae bacterium]